MNPLKAPDYRGLVALIIATAFSISIVMTVVGAMVTGRPIAESALDVISVLGGALVGVLATYIGGSALGKSPPSNEDRRE